MRRILVTVALLVGIVTVTGCDDGPTCEQRGKRTVQDAPVLIMTPIFGDKGQIITFIPNWVPQSHCEAR